MEVQYNCRHFKGTVPCKPHKKYGVECGPDCSHYEEIKGNILIIKLGAMGDVIRTTPLLKKLKKEYPEHRIYWLTYFLNVLPEGVDVPLSFNVESLTYLQSVTFDLGINLDKEPEACALMDQLNIKNKYGFGLNLGMPAPINELAEHKFKTGISDSYSKSNTQHYLQEIFSICGWEYNGEEYILPEAKSKTVTEKIDNGNIYIGLNTGCGKRWTSRQWPLRHWNHLAKILIENQYSVILLGGGNEDTMNRAIARSSGAEYFGYFPFNEFIYLVDMCDLVVSTVTMAMHVAIGLKKSLVLLNNIFNPKEFHFFVPSIILGPEKDCECFYRPTCINDINCIEDVKPKTVFEAVTKLIQK